MAIRMLLLFLLTLFTADSVNAQGRQLTFVFPQEKNAFHDAAAEIIRQAYATLNVTVVYKTYPAERALQMSNKGLSDGELVRIKDIETKYPNLIRIPVSHVTAEQMAFGKDASVKIDGWKSLKPYRLVFHRGYKVAEQNTVGMNRHLTGTDIIAFKMGDKGRMDIVIANRFTGAKVIQDQGLKHIVMLTPPLQRNPLYHYVHSRHRDLVDDVTRVLKSMQSQGDFSKILKQFGITSKGH